MKKTNYVAPELEMILVASEDVITASVIETPDDEIEE